MSTLTERIPERGFADPSEALDAFFAWVADRGVTPYRHQEEAVLELFDDRHVLLKTPTGSGKSLVALAAHFLWFARARRSVYTAPIKALVSEKFFELCRVFGAEHVGLMTGDGSVNRDAPILCCTAEVLAKLALRHGAETPFAGVVMDEFHYYGDRDRGMAWHLPLITMERARFLLMSATLGDTQGVEAALLERTGAAVSVVESQDRPVPLRYVYSEDPAHERLDRLARSGQAPVYAVHFTQRDAAEQAQALLSTDFCSPDEKAKLKAATGKFRFDSPFGPTLRRMVQHGVGLHHAGLLPKYRLLVEKLAQQGLFKVICGTDTLGVGINVPIRTVFFTQLCKFDGDDTRILSVRDFRQIAGRAGRKGFDDQGWVVAQAPDWVIENARLEQQIVSGQKKRNKVQKKKPPTRGYRHWDAETFEQLQVRPPEALEPVFRVDAGLWLLLLQKAEETGGDAEAELDQLIERSHVAPRAKEAARLEARQRLDALLASGVVGRDTDGALELHGELQADFSLHHSLSLFLLHAVAQLDRASPTYALDVISVVEAILEHPRPILAAQVQREKTERVAQLKAEGVEYEERMEALDDVTWPKPKGEWLYATFNAWAASRPWLPEDPVRPKSVAREMVESAATFSGYVKGLRLERVEGVLLRYLSQVLQTLRQNVPLDLRDDAVDDHIGALWAMIGRVDDSLLTAWETLLDGGGAEAVDSKPVDISADPRTFAARIRAELHNVVRALIAGDPEEAAASLHPDGLYDADALSAAYAAYVDAEGVPRFEGAARLANRTQLRADGPHRWRVRQLLPTRDPDDDGAWALEGVVDLRGDTNPSGPLVRREAFGDG